MWVSNMAVKDDEIGQVAAGKWVNFTFVDLDACGSVDCLATIKLGHDDKHATQKPSQQEEQIKQETKE